ncbi:MAG: hypothetical protein Q8O87_03155 [bacterium]|nr:hypothetical protein [bacterium]
MKNIVSLAIIAVITLTIAQPLVASAQVEMPFDLEEERRHEEDIVDKPVTDEYRYEIDEYKKALELSDEEAQSKKIKEINEGIIRQEYEKRKDNGKSLSQNSEEISKIQGQVEERAKIEKSRENVGSCGWNDFGCHLTLFVGKLLNGVAYGINLVVGTLIALAGALINILATLSSTLPRNQFVLTGFALTLNFANLGFVLAIIFIALTTILRLEKYKTKDLLWKLIVAAVLVNFSFAITGFILDFANIIGSLFLEAATGGDVADIAASLSNTVDLGKLSTIQSGGSISTLIELLVLFSGFVIKIIFSVMVMVTFFVFAFMMLMRNIWLIMLLILMPAVWLLWIFPDTSQHWKNWWNKFISWTFFYPISMFFFYLAINSSGNVSDKITENLNNQSNTIIAFGNLDIDADGLTTYLGLFVKIGLIIGGLIAAQQMGIASAGIGLKAAGGIKGWATGKAGKITKGAAKATAGAGAKAAGATLGQKMTSSKPWKGAANLASKMGLTGLAAGMYNRTEAPKRAAAESQKQLASDSNDAILAKSKRAYSPQEKAAHANELVKRGIEGDFIKKYGQASFGSLLNAAKDTGHNKDILENSMEYGKKVIHESKLVDNDGKKLEGGARDNKILEIAATAYNPAKTAKIKTGYIKEGAQYFNLKLARTIFKDGNAEQTGALKEVANEIAKTEGGSQHPLVRMMKITPAAQQGETTSHKKFGGRKDFKKGN